MNEDQIIHASMVIGQIMVDLDKGIADFTDKEKAEIYRQTASQCAALSNDLRSKEPK